MRKLLTSAFAILTLSCSAQMRWSERYQQYINQYKDVAIEQMLRWKIPASITIAQGLLESGAGQSELTRKANNHFGIKCHGWTGRTAYHDDDEQGECFRAYNNAFESYEDHSRFLAGSQRYRSLFQLNPTDYKGWANGLKKAGYATSPTYATKLIEIIQLYKLYQYDDVRHYDKFMAEQTKTAPVTGQSLHPIKIFNKNYYLIARQGDTYYSIGKETGISYRKIARYNERNKKDALTAGEVVWLKKKQTKAPKEYKNKYHRVANGESMYSIAQAYGIRVKSLYKLNRFTPDHEIRVGDLIKLR